MKAKITIPDFSFLNQIVKKLNEQITKTHHRFLKTVVIFEARNYAGKNLPGKNENSMEPYTSSITGAYGGLKKEIASRLLGGVQKAIGAINLATSNQKIAAKENVIVKETERKEHLMIDRDRIHLDGDFSSYQSTKWLLSFFTIGECIWNASFFIRIGDISLVAALIGILIGAAQIILVKTSVMILKQSEDSRKQLYYSIALVSGFIIFSLLMGNIRYWFVHQGEGAAIPFMVMNPMVFASINLLFVFATAVVVYLYFPTMSEAKQIKKIEAIDREIEKIESKIEKLESELKLLLDERAFLIELSTRTKHAEDAIFARVEALYAEAIGAFKLENTVKRSDGCFPDSFKSSHSSLPNYGSGEFLLNN